MNKSKNVKNTYVENYKKLLEKTEKHLNKWRNIYGQEESASKICQFLQMYL